MSGYFRFEILEILVQKMDNLRYGFDGQKFQSLIIRTKPGLKRMPRVVKISGSSSAIKLLQTTTRFEKAVY